MWNAKFDIHIKKKCGMRYTALENDRENDRDTGGIRNTEFDISIKKVRNAVFDINIRK